MGLQAGNPKNVVGLSWECTHHGPYVPFVSLYSYIPTIFSRFSVLSGFRGSQTVPNSPQGHYSTYFSVRVGFSGAGRV